MSSSANQASAWAVQFGERGFDDPAAAASSSRVQAGGGEIGAQVGQQQAHGAQDAGIARHQDAADVQLARQPRGMQRPGAAERHQGVVARIMAALHAR